MSARSRSREEFREQLRKSIDFTDMRLMSTAALARNVDAEAVNKCRLSLYGKQSEMIRRMTTRSEDYEQMERARASKGDYSLDAREFALEDNVAQIYFNYYGHNFYGGRVVDSPDKGWTCPHCGLKHMMSLKTLPPYCDRCHYISPIGEMIRDGVMRR